MFETNKTPEWLILVKSTDDHLSPALEYFSQRIPGVKPIQLVGSLKRKRNYKGIPAVYSAQWLAKLEA